MIATTTAVDRQLRIMLLLLTGVGTLFYAAVCSVELVVEGAVRGYFGKERGEAAIGRLNILE